MLVATGNWQLAIGDDNGSGSTSSAQQGISNSQVTGNAGRIIRPDH